MNIIVCVKQVPGTNKVAVDPVTGVLIRDGVDSKINPYDLFALEEGFALAEKYGGQVKTLSMGPPMAKEALKETIYMGASEAVLLSDRKFGGADVAATSCALGLGVGKIGEYDLIICGKQTTDGDTAQVGAEISEYLKIANVSNVLSVENVSEKEIELTASLDEKVVSMAVKLPCLISAEGDINSPRLPSYKIRQTITDDMVKFISLSDLDDKNPDHYGLSGSATQVERIFPPDKNKEKTSFDGNPEEQCENLFGLISNLKLV